MAIAPSNTQYLYVADYSHIWKTSNGGMTWTDITGTIPSGAGTITSIAVKNDDPNTLWVTLGGYTANTIYQSLNGGNTWADISGGLPQLPVYTIVQNKQSTTEVHLYVGTELGVYFKKGTNDWIPFNTDLPNVKLGELEIYYSANPQNSLIRAATYGRGLWETPVYYVCTPTPSPTISGPSIVCTGAQVVNYTTETGMTGYSWSVTSEGTITGGAGTNQVTVSWNSPGAGSVFVNYTNSSGCSAENPSNYTVTVSQAPAADFSFPANNCEMQNVQFTDLSSQNGGDTLTSWNWDFGDPGSGSGNMSTLQNPLHLYTLAANYTVEEIVTNLHGCTDTIFHQINIHPLPPAIITPNGPTTFCEGDSVVLSASSASSYIWSDGEISQSITVSISGTYSVTVTNGFGCMATSVPTTVTMLPLAGIPEIPAGPDTVDVHTIFSSSYFTYSAPGAVTYSWQVNPSDAGTIGGSDTTGNMVWSTSFMGNARISVMSVNSCGVSSWSGEMLTVVLNTTGTGNKSPFTILIYPNPATTQLTVEFPEFSSNPAAFLDLYEIQGQWIKKVTITEKKTQVDISTLPVGIYLIRLTLGNDSRMIKVVKTE
jgi:PKD repeat protein